MVELSSLYIDVTRDRLYCDAENSRERRSAQSALYLMADGLARMLAPLIPFTADEIYSHIPGRTADSVHLLTLAPPDDRFVDAELDARWERLLAVRGEALKVLEAMRQAGEIGAPLEAKIEVGLENPDFAAMLGNYREPLKDLFIVSEIAILSNGAAPAVTAQADNPFERFAANLPNLPPIRVTGRKAAGRKCPRCWKYFAGDGDLEERCRAVVGG